MGLGQFRERLRGRFKRVSSDLFFRRLRMMGNTVPSISFTFDDFPRSALLTGGTILENYGLAGTYYASLGCMGQGSPSGDLFLLQDLMDLVDKGHELGCHTFAHLDAWETSTREFMASVAQNRKALTKLLPRAEFNTLSYPLDHPRPLTKRRVAQEFRACRGGGQKINHGRIDLNVLSAYFLDRRREDLDRVKSVIDENADIRGWLIFGTHDVCENPSPFGCTPDYFEAVVRHAVKSGAIVAPVARALESLFPEGPSEE